MEISTEMLMTRAKAIFTCVSLSVQFANHFEKALEDKRNNFDTFIHHCTELNSFWNSVKNIRLKPNNRLITDVNLIDCFFTGGQDVTDMVSEENEEIYNKFINILLRDRNIDIVKAFDILFEETNNNELS